MRELRRAVRGGVLDPMVVSYASKRPAAGSFYRKEQDGRSRLQIPVVGTKHGSACTLSPTDHHVVSVMLTQARWRWNDDEHLSRTNKVP